MKFLHSKSGGEVALDQIVTMRSVGRGAEAATVATLRDGSTVEFWQDTDRISTMLDPVIPAQPGFELLRIWLGENGLVEVIADSVIAWRINAYGVTPITVHGIDEDSAIKQPTWPGGEAGGKHLGQRRGVAQGRGAAPAGEGCEGKGRA